MAELLKNEKEIERVVLVAVCRDTGDDTTDSIAELAELLETDGAEVLGTCIQNLEAANPVTYVGKGKLTEIKEMVLELDATGIVCDDELSPIQMRNMERDLETKVMDRTMVILDIFAQRAITSEGKIQVELAQLNYRSTRLTGFGVSMSRQGGTQAGQGSQIGSRGPGEKKLELDKRLIRSRIAQLRRELEEVRKHRDVTRSQREQSQVKVAAIVGYTNAGKSTLLNHLTQADVLEEDKLFATLDPTTRMLQLDNGQQILLTDTVGFIRKLPHHLIEAFRSTLEEAKYADYIIHVVDASNPQREKQMHIVYETLEQLGVKDKKIVTLFNKQDLATDQEPLRDLKADVTISIEAKHDKGLDEVKEVLEKFLREDKILLEKVFHYEDAGNIQKIRKYGELLEEEYREDGIYVKAYVPRELYNI